MRKETSEGNFGEEKKSDKDKDGMPDAWEDLYQLDKNDPADAYEDLDMDLLINRQEYVYKTDPNNPDTDGDGYQDGQEVKTGFNPVLAGGAKLDLDADGMPDFWEEVYGLDKQDPGDADDDNDEDGLVNVDEFEYGTDPSNPDTDGDGRLDGQEVDEGYDPAIPGEARLRSASAQDTDRDNMPDWWEDLYAMNKNDPGDRNLDFDEDGLINADEFKYNADPYNAVTDFDGRLDGLEVSEGFDPALPGQARLPALDTDSDGVSDIEETELYGTNPNNFDSDGDGAGDGRELDDGTDPTGEGNINAVLFVPEIGISVPIIWSRSTVEEDIQVDLEKGAAHYPGTATPGRLGAVVGYVTAHSSYYEWAPGEYKFVFEDLYRLEVGDTFYFEYYLNNGRKVVLDYKIIETDVVTPDDPKLFSSSQQRLLNLVSCHPPGTSLKRVMFTSVFLNYE